jgi:prepilin-type N-terminal cleavage/methylation domain
MKRARGVTLIELMVVVVIVGILASIAVPAYSNYVIRANRTDGRIALLTMASALEQCYTRFNRYDDARCAVDVTDVPSPDRKYLLNGEVTANTFVLTAVPQGGQAADTGCGSLTLNERNVRGRSGTKPVEECWGR